MSVEGRRIEIRGVVQGVGFRPWVVRLARQVGIAGRVRNDGAGVTVDAFGPPSRLEAFTARLRRDPPPGAQVRSLAWRSIAPEAMRGFDVATSDGREARRLAIPPDRATCADCLAELADPDDVRHGHPFITCTHCGPRFTIAVDVPYDRAATTMAVFPMCPRCRREYEDPADRRFHAEPIACPACGPRLRLRSGEGLPVAGDPVATAADALRGGCVVAVKGLGGFHLACDACSEDAVARLRQRKARDAKPFAVMVASPAEADALALLSDDERALLAAPGAPIVLVRRRPEAPLAPGVAPASPLVGLLLAYTPLHHLLLGRVHRPLVMTSGNLAGEPIAFRDEEALARLGPIADLVLDHDRAIVAPCEDSVTRVIAGAPALLRRSRGWVPRPIPLARPVSRPVLACGGDLKSVVCLARGDEAYLGPHLGDLDRLESLEALADAAERLQRLLGCRAQVVAHDLHPAYHSAAFARALPDVQTIGVQHHHAHVASAIGEHGLEGAVLGVAYDGTGWGPDGTAWGGEVLLADVHRFERVATFRPLALAGGERAIREVWRLALAALDDAFDGAPPLERLRPFAAVGPARIAAVRGLLAAGVACPAAHGVGRWFDVLGAIGLGMPESRFEGEVAMAWGNAADAHAAGTYACAIDRAATPWVIDPRPVLRAAVADLLAGDAPGAVAARFHRAIVRATVAVVQDATAYHGRLPVVLTGGCFQNPWLTEGVQHGLASTHAVHLHRDVPAGDGGLALGQALVADAKAGACA